MLSETACIQLLCVTLVASNLISRYLLLLARDPQKDALWRRIDKVGVPPVVLPWTRDLELGDEPASERARRLPQVLEAEASVHAADDLDGQGGRGPPAVDAAAPGKPRPPPRRSRPASASPGVTGRSYARLRDGLFSAAAIINCMPPFLRPVHAPILAWPTQRHRDRYREVVVSVIEERIRLWAQHIKTGKGERRAAGARIQCDFTQWLIARAAQHRPGHLDPAKLSYRLFALNTTIVYAMGFVFAQTVLNLCACPKSARFLDGIAAECARVAARYPDGLASPAAIEQTHRADSAIRESMRVSEVGVVLLPCDVVGSKVLDLGIGVVCPPGTRLVWPTQCIQHDPESWVDPLRSDAFRFSDLFEQDGVGGKEREKAVDPMPTFRAWG
ncbi:hypothetical protein F4780DRAFT_784252 [Xylariomycetidae sp. FL0641]|nr:hypothetical protein F4780DRAFT_784252 [Xylariomycetidae sp. FL0641]